MRIPRSPKACSRRLRTCTARQFTSSVRDMTKPKEGPGRKPEWLKKPLPKAGALREMERLLRERSLHTVCESARCPNKGECFEHGTATFLICLLYTSDAADDLLCVDLGGRRIIKKKTNKKSTNTT